MYPMIAFYDAVIVFFVVFRRTGRAADAELEGPLDQPLLRPHAVPPRVRGAGLCTSVRRQLGTGS